MKKYIKNSFNIGAKKYDNFNHIQNLAGDSLIEILKNNTNILSIKQKKINALELGSGTGEFTKKILNNLNIGKLELVDISEEMILVSKSKIKRKTLFNNVDFDKYDYSNLDNFELIFSNMAIHWSSNYIKLITSIIMNLKKGGIFLFSFPNNKSFSVLKKIYQKEEKEFTLNSLPDFLFYKGFFDKSYVDFRIKEINFKISYKSPIAFLKNLKNIGANASIQKKKENIFFLKKFNKSININFNVSFCLIIKK